LSRIETREFDVVADDEGDGDGEGASARSRFVNVIIVGSVTSF